MSAKGSLMYSVNDEHTWLGYPSTSRHFLQFYEGELKPTATVKRFSIVCWNEEWSRTRCNRKDKTLGYSYRQITLSKNTTSTVNGLVFLGRGLLIVQFSDSQLLKHDINVYWISYLQGVCSLEHGYFYECSRRSIEPRSPALWADSLPLSHQGSPYKAQ